MRVLSLLMKRGDVYSGVGRILACEIHLSVPLAMSQVDAEVTILHFVKYLFCHVPKHSGVAVDAKAMTLSNFLLFGSFFFSFSLCLFVLCVLRFFSCVFFSCVSCCFRVFHVFRVFHFLMCLVSFCCCFLFCFFFVCVFLCVCFVFFCVCFCHGAKLDCDNMLAVDDTHKSRCSQVFLLMCAR